MEPQRTPKEKREERKDMVEDLQRKLADTQDRLDDFEAEANDYAEKYVAVLERNRQLQQRVTNLESKIVARTRLSAPTPTPTSAAPTAPAPASTPLSAMAASALNRKRDAAQQEQADEASKKVKALAYQGPENTDPLRTPNAQRTAPLAPSSHHPLLMGLGAAPTSAASITPKPVTPLKQIFSQIRNNPGGKN